MQTFYDGRGVHQVPGAQRTREVRVQLCHFNPARLHFLHRDRSAEETERVLLLRAGTGPKGPGPSPSAEAQTIMSLQLQRVLGAGNRHKGAVVASPGPGAGTGATRVPNIML